MADFGKVGGGKGAKGGRGKRPSVVRSPISKIGGRKAAGYPDYHCKFEVNEFHVSGGRGATYTDIVLGSFEEVGRRNSGLFQASTGDTRAVDIGFFGVVGSTKDATIKLQAGSLFGGSNGALFEAHTDAKFDFRVDGASGDGASILDYESRNSAWSATQAALQMTLSGVAGRMTEFETNVVAGVTGHIRVWFDGDDDKFNGTARLTP